MKIWFVDDLASNRQMWLNSFPEEVKAQNQWRTFPGVPDLLAAAQEDMPDVLFIDYYIGDHFGHEVVEHFLKCQPRPFLIAHSSAFAANRAMVQQGADLMLEKKPGRAFTRSIAEAISCQADLETWRR